MNEAIPAWAHEAANKLSNAFAKCAERVTWDNLQIKIDADVPNRARVKAAQIIFECYQRAQQCHQSSRVPS